MTLLTEKPAIKGSVFIHLDFVLTGIVMTVLGPLLPVLSARWMLDDAKAGFLFTAQFVMGMLGMLLSGFMVQRQGSRITLIGGLVLMAAGIGILPSAGWILGLAAVSIFSVGYGITTPTANLRIAETHPENRAAALNLVNSSWGIGAMACPIILAAAQRSQHLPVFLRGTTAALLALAACLSWVRFAGDGKRARREESSSTGLWRNPLVFLIVGLFFIYVGTEASVGGWVASFAQRIDAGPHSYWAVMPSFFWGSLLAGRVLAPLLLRRIGETPTAIAGLIVAALGTVALLSAHSLTMIAVGASVAGLGLSSIFPISISMFTHWFGEMSSSISGAMFAVGNLGGAALPWIVGALSTHFGSLRVGFVVPLFGSILMLTVYVVKGRQQRVVLETA